jgi:hypothetical protein
VPRKYGLGKAVGLGAAVSRTNGSSKAGKAARLSQMLIQSTHLDRAHPGATGGLCGAGPISLTSLRLGRRSGLRFRLGLYQRS